MLMLEAVSTSSLEGGQSHLNKLHRQRIDAVPRVFWCEALAAENMAEVSTAMIAEDFDTTPVFVGDFFHRIGKRIVEGRPAAARIEFIAAAVKRGFTTAANEYAVFFPFVVFTGKRVFSPFVHNDVLFVRCELVPMFFVEHNVGIKKAFPGVERLFARYVFFGYQKPGSTARSSIRSSPSLM